MELNNYVAEDEEVLEEAVVYQGTNAISSEYKGTLACTPRRAVFVSESEATDISLQAVNSIEYHLPGVPWKHIAIAAGVLILGVIAAGIAQFLEAGGLVPVVLGVPTLMAVGVLVAGVLLRRHQLRIHTPGKSFTFEAKEELEAIAQAIRAQEVEQ